MSSLRDAKKAGLTLDGDPPAHRERAEAALIKRAQPSFFCVGCLDKRKLGDELAKGSEVTNFKVLSN